MEIKYNLKKFSTSKLTKFVVALVNLIMKSNKIEPKFITKHNPRVGLIALATDFIIEKDFINVIKDKEIDFFVNRIECYNPLSKENLIKMSEKVTDVTKNILPDENIDCVGLRMYFWNYSCWT